MIRVLVVAALAFLAAGEAQAQVAPCKFAANVAHFDAVATRGARPVPVRIYYPLSFTCEATVVAVSHGGEGQPPGAQDYGYMEFYGERLARHGFVALIVRHYVSAPSMPAFRDRPADVTTLLDALDSRAIAMPADFTGTLNFERVGHLGHSFGAFTGESLAGLDVLEWSGSNFTALEDFGRDQRIAAIVAISPQGPGSIGQVDMGQVDSSWSDIATPTYVLVGEDEDTGEPGNFVSPGWRMTGFYRMPADGARFLSGASGPKSRRDGRRRRASREALPDREYAAVSGHLPARRTRRYVPHRAIASRAWNDDAAPAGQRRGGERIHLLKRRASRARRRPAETPAPPRHRSANRRAPSH